MNVTAGTTARITGTIKNFDGALADPGSLEADVVNPAGVSTTLVYGVSGAFTRLAAGKYQLLIDTAIGVQGGYQVTWRSSGGVVVVAKTTIYAQ